MRSVLSFRPIAVTLSVLALALPACGDDDGAGASDRPQVVVTTSILGDIVRHVVGDAGDVEVIMPLGADPHEFAPSTRQAEAMAEADLLVVNGAGFEQGLHSVIEAAREAGAPTFTFAEHVTLHAVDEHAEEEHAEEEHADGEAADGHEHEGGEDPHLWMDPALVAGAVPALGEALAGTDGVDGEAVTARASEYAAALEALDADIRALLEPIPADRRVLVTNHEAFGYFAQRYGFDIIGTVIPSLTTRAESSAADLEALAAVIQDHELPAIFAETTQPRQLAEALADEVGGGVEVVELYTESLGEEGSGAETYVGMLRTDAELIAEALT